MIGSGLSTPRAALGEPEAEDWRAYLERAARAVAEVPVCGALLPIFEATRGGPTARLVRLLGLLGSLPGVLEGLRTAVRRQTRTERWWAHHPQGGRIDVAASLVAHARLSPRPWRLMRVRPCADSPTNALLASGLADIADHLIGLRRLGLYRKESAAFERAERVLGRFLAQSPLGEVEPAARARWSTLRRAARRRSAEYAAVRPFIDWWDALRATRLEALTADDTPLSVGGCFELTVLIHLVAGFADRHPIVEAPASGRPNLVLSGHPIWIRNLAPESADDLRGMLAEGTLLTPADVLRPDGRPDFTRLVQRLRYAL